MRKLKLPFKITSKDTGGNFAAIQNWANSLVDSAESGEVAPHTHDSKDLVQDDFSITSQMDDFVIPATITRLGTSPPSLGNWSAYASSSPRLRTMQFSGSTPQTVEISAQMPHSWEIGSEYNFHLHLSLETADNAANAGKKISFEFQYIRGNVNGIFSEPINTTVEYTITGSETNKTQFLTTTNVVFDGAGYEQSHLIIGTLTRLAGTTDTYTDIVHLHSSDFHILKDTLGKTLHP